MEFPGVALIVGAGSGIGRTTAKLYAKHGCSRIVIGDINMMGLDQTEQQMQYINGSTEILSLRIDVTSEDSVNLFFSNAVKKFGRVDYACNIAGVLIPGSSPEFSVAAFDKQFGINLRGMWMCQRAEIIQMLLQKPIKSSDSNFSARGAIVNVASMAGIRGYDNLPSYCATKFGIIGFTKADALKYAVNKIRINAICPGIIATPMLGEIKDENVEEITKDVAMGRQGLPEEIAEGIVWVSSGRASLMTATTLALNGGMVGA